MQGKVPSVVIVLALLSGCDQPGGKDSAPPVAAAATSGRPADEQRFLDNRDIKTFDPEHRVQNAPNEVVKAQIETSLDSQRCDELHTWKVFHDWTGRVETLEKSGRGLKVTVSLNNTGHELLYVNLIGNIAKASPFYAAAIQMKDGGYNGTPVLVSGRIDLKPVRIPPQYKGDEDFRSKVYGVCSGLNDIPVTFTNLRSTSTEG